MEQLQELQDEQHVMLCARFAISSDPPRGACDLAVAIDKVHFFDLETGLAIR